MIKIRFFSSFTISEKVKPLYERICESHLISDYGENKKIYFTNDDDYTHVIILNTAMPVLKKNIHKKNVIGLSFEPSQFLRLSSQFIEYAQKNISKYFIGDKGNLPDPFIEGCCYIWHITPITYIPIKNKYMSIVLSQKQFAPGHAYRHTLVKAILKSNLPIDIYGRGCCYYNDPRVKGIFNEIEPYENYYFHICIENFQSNHYLSEKILNPLLCNTKPIYLGCRNIKDYFKQDIIMLTGNVDEDMLLLTTILKNPEIYKSPINLAEIKDNYNIIKNIDKLFNE
jgi:hypothetical protein